MPDRHAAPEHPAPGLVFQVEIEDRHLKLIGDLALVVVAEQDADELFIDIDLGGIVLSAGAAALAARASGRPS